MVRRLSIKPKWLSEKWLLSVMRFGWVEAERRKGHIRRRGLPVRLSVEWDGNFLSIVVNPLRGYVYLYKRWLHKDICRRYGPLHISLCHYKNLDDRGHWEVEHLKRRWHGWRGRLPIRDIRRDGYLLVGGPLFEDPAAQFLHGAGKFATWGFHISG